MITNYTTLQTTLAEWLNRTDLSAVLPVMIQLAESKFRRDPRVRKLQNAGTVAVSADDYTLASDFMAMESWYMDGPTDYHRIEIVGAEKLGQLKLVHGTTGAPKFAAIIDGKARFAPVPNASFSTKLTYWRKVTALSESNATNWLIESHPDVYLYGALVESAPYIKDDERLPMWKAELEARLEEISQATQLEQYPVQPTAEDQRITRARP